MFNIYNHVINGLILASIYSLNAFGFTLVFGAIRIINFAQIEMAMLGAFLAIAITIILIASGFSSVIFIVCVILFVGSCIDGVFGVILDKIAIKKVRGAPSVAGLLLSLGLALMIENIIMLAVGSDIKVLPELNFGEKVSFLGFYLTSVQSTILIITFIVLMLIDSFLNKTRLGMAVRATGENAILARTMGIDTEKTISITFFLAAICGAVAGICMALYYGVARFDMGLMPGLKGFSAAVVGGMGNPRGAIIGGLILGLAEQFTGGYISSSYQDVVAFLLLIIVLVVKPSGILGGRTSSYHLFGGHP